MAGPMEPAVGDALAGEYGPLGRQVRAGLRWSIVNTLVSRFLSVAVGLVLARILSPRDYGTFTVGLVALNVLQSVNELGVSVALVRWQGDPRRPARTGMTISLASSALLYAGTYVAAPRLAALLQAPEATGLLRLVTLGVVLDGLSSVPNAFLARAMLQGRRAVADTVALVTSSLITLVLAAQGMGAWSLAWGSLVGNVIATVLICAMAPERSLPGFDIEDARKLLAAGVPLAGSSFLVFAMLNVDYVIVGRLLGPTVLGYYVLAFNLSSWPTNLLSFSIRRVSVAAFSRLADVPRELNARFVSSFAILMATVIPIVVVVSVLASPVVVVLYGERWARAVDALRFLIVLGGIRVGFDLCYDALVAAGRSGAVLVVQAIWFVVLIPVLWIGARAAGLAGVGVGHLAVALLVVAPAFLVALKGMGVTAGALGRPLWRPAAAGVLAATVALGVSHFVEGRLLELGLAGGTSVLAYTAVVVPVRQLLGRNRDRSSVETEVLESAGSDE